MQVRNRKISLNSLQISTFAHSGCITSAESVLITLQSHVEVLSFLSSNPPIQSPYYRLPVLSIAPQSLASLSTSISTPGEPPIPLQRILNRIRAFCAQKLGIPQVYDTTFARHVALLEHRREFMERKACGQGKLPMLASACPGWVCYAEKAHAEMLPFMSRTKSPQQVMGTLIKEWMGNRYRRRFGLSCFWHQLTRLTSLRAVLIKSTTLQ
jgi:iron only hydrogenase large subunit-like protein